MSRNIHRKQIFTLTQQTKYHLTSHLAYTVRKNSNTLLVNTSQTSKCCNQHVKRIRHNPAVTTIQLLSQTINARLPNQILKHSSQNGTTNQRRPLTSKFSSTCVPHQTHRHWLKPSTIFMDVTRHKALHKLKLIIAKTCPYVTLRATSTSSQRSPLGTSIATDSKVKHSRSVLQRVASRIRQSAIKLATNNTTKHIPKNIPTKPSSQLVFSGKFLP